MATKKNTPAPGDFDYPEPTGDFANIPEIDASFDLETDAKADPLVPPGTYFANVTKVWYNPERYCITWRVVLEGNEGVMSDGETAVDGASLLNNNWLPKPGDEDEPTASGRTNKRQSKINMLAKFANQMGIDMSTPAKIMEALQNAEWVGLRVQVQVGLREYEGNTYNEIKSMKAA